jgi:hypothetical protein
MTVMFQVERLRDMHEEMKPLLEKHWHEIALDHSRVPLDVDWDRYMALDEKESLSVVTAREDGVLVGYHVAIISGHLHYKSTLHGVTDVYWIDPSYRQRPGVGLRLFKAVNEEMKRLGVVKLITGTKVHLDMGRLFQHLGYRETERTFTKIVGD